MTLTRRKFLKAASAAALTVSARPSAGRAFELKGRMSPGPRALQSTMSPISPSPNTR
ncbi:MAG: twin-arginine translocation signal domain-containing protein [Deltaproteobacteria bacterium]|nr:twin-arginine translocation signal domain-containing protein [Deltaproteobacteria bacterium]